LASQAIAAMLLMLLLSFAVFCRYYQWRMPAIENPVSTTGNSVTSESKPFPRTTVPQMQEIPKKIPKMIRKTTQRKQNRAT
jgi:hypothetical protein